MKVNLVLRIGGLSALWKFFYFDTFPYTALLFFDQALFFF